jgi:hypothetical protein
MSDLIDTSNTSIALGSVVALATFFGFRHYLNIQSLKNDDEEDSNEVILKAILGAIIVTFMILVIFKKYLVYVGSQSMLEEPFD